MRSAKLRMARETRPRTSQLLLVRRPAVPFSQSSVGPLSGVVPLSAPPAPITDTDPAVGVFFAGVLFAARVVVFLLPVVFRAVVFRAVVLRAVVFLRPVLVARRVVPVFRAVLFLAVVFFLLLMV